MAFTNACSLISSTTLSVPPATWTIAQFIGSASESSDVSNWHDAAATGSPSGYITPNVSGWGLVAGEAQWSSSGDATEFRMQFIRDPAGIMDTTGTNHVADTPGGDYMTTVWPMYVDSGTAYAFRVQHNASTNLTLTLAQFKVLV